jgi:tryptophan halogenase
MNSHDEFHLVIIGGCGDEWLVASTLANALSRSLKITVICKDQDNKASVLSFLPIVKSFHELAGVSEASLVSTASCTFNLGTQYRKWSSPSSEFVFPHASPGFAISGIDFYHYLNLLHAEGDKINIDDYSVSAQAGKQNKFRKNTHPRTLLASSLSYSFNIDSQDYLSIFRHHANRKQVREIRAKIIKVMQADTGDIKSVLLDTGETVSADFWIDCSGEVDSAISCKLNNKFESWHDVLPINRVLEVNLPCGEHLSPLIQLCWSEHGWMRETQLKNRTVVEFYFFTEHISDQEAFETLALIKGLPHDCQPVFKSIKLGSRPECWQKNCVFMGHGASCIPELVISNSHILQNAIFRFIDLFPRFNNNSRLAEEYNRITENEVLNIFDFQQMHFMLSQKPDKSFWHVFYPKSIAENLIYKIETFKKTGRVSLFEEETLSEDMWATFFIGNNCWPEAINIFVRDLPLDMVRNKLIELRAKSYEYASELPLHKDYLKQLLI